MSCMARDGSGGQRDMTIHMKGDGDAIQASLGNSRFVFGGCGMRVGSETPLAGM
ncbi:MAG: hypothetical protein ACRBM6_03615 [Geminicoccales bacterium]